MNGDLKLTLPPPLELQLLAAPGQLQAAWLVAEGYSNDELGMQFDDWFEVFLPTIPAFGVTAPPLASLLSGLSGQTFGQIFPS